MSMLILAQLSFTNKTSLPAHGLLLIEEAL